MRNGRTPALSSFIFSPSGTWRSSLGSTGPRWGWSRQRTAM